jgi:hypothetical protein
MQRSVVLSLTLLLLAGVPGLHGNAQPADRHQKRALLIGINLYEPAGTKAQHPAGCQGGRCDLPVFKDLNGPINDVAAMRDLLSSPKFGFAPQNITVLTNPDLPATQLLFGKVAASETSHDGLLAVMRKYLVDLPSPGDTVVFYYAGHGSLRVNSKGNKLAMMVDGKPSHADSTLVPSDAWKGIHDVRDRETTAIFNAALDKGIKLTVLLDSCHSGSFTRGVEMGPQYTERSLGYDPVDVNEAPELLPSGEPKPAPSQRKTNPALIFSAAQQDQTAKERVFGDTPGASSHGAFTVALIKALQSLPANAPASVVYRQVRATIEGEGVGDQMPSIDASAARLSQPLFGGEKSDSGKTRAAVIGADDDGKVWLDAGQLSGIDVGSEFTSIAKDDQGRLIKLRVESLEGITHSMAKVVLPLKAKVAAGQVFELTKWVPREVDTLHFWTWPPSLSQAAIQSVADQIKASGFKPVEDPVEQPWTDMLAWNGSEWELRHAARIIDTPIGPNLSAGALQSASSQYGRFCVDKSLSSTDMQLVNSVQAVDASLSAKLDNCHTFLVKEKDIWVIHHVEKASTQSIGTQMTAELLKKNLSSNARLWVNLPPPQELFAKLALHEPNSLVAEAKDVADADYILAGTLSDDGTQWAWFHKPEYLAGPRASVTKDHSPGCSTQSKYPVSSDWVLAPDSASLDDASAALNKYSSLLAKVNGWLNLSSNLSGASSADYYRLVFKRVGDNSELNPDEAAKQDERLRMYLTSESRVSEKRWVYVLDIDCHGKGTLLYPNDTTDNRFPNDADSPHTDLELPGAPTLRIGPPYGLDTVMLISTQEPLPDPYTLNFEGVGTRSASRGGSNPLQQLLSNTSAGTRGPVPEMPTNWSVDSYTLQSVPR